VAREQVSRKEGSPVPPKIVIPTGCLSATRVAGSQIFIVFEGKAAERSIKTGNSTSKGIEVAEGLIGGEEIVLSPPPTLKDGDRIA
jgi:hypothetical protein